jgi:TPP-dependent pyruvate/acetoin dehydrogenase alpha subunit
MRMRGHAEHDDMKYVPAAMLEEISQRDTIDRYERSQFGSVRARPKELAAVTSALEASLQQDLAAAEASPFPDPRSGLSGVYGDRPVPSPVPPLVSEWKRGKGGG